MLAALCYNCCSILINVKRKIGNHEIHFFTKGTLNKSEDRQRKEDQQYQVPPTHPPQGEHFQIHPEKRLTVGKMKNKYLRDLKHKVTHGILQTAMALEKFSAK